MRNKVAGVAIAASLLAGGSAATAFTPMAAFAEDTTTTESAQATARTPAQWVTDALKGLVDKGTITQAQSDAVAQALEQARPEGGHGHGGPGGLGGRGHLSAAKVAEVLGMSEADLRTALSQNKSIATIAAERKVDVKKVIDALVAEENAALDQAVKDGRITQAQADARKANTVERVTNMVNNARPAGGPRGDRGSKSGTTGSAPPTTTAPTAA